jgi:hypothetical protein
MNYLRQEKSLRDPAAGSISKLISFWALAPLGPQPSARRVEQFGRAILSVAGVTLPA